jgi:hypothetical protein
MHLPSVLLDAEIANIVKAQSAAGAAAAVAP